MCMLRHSSGANETWFRAMFVSALSAYFDVSFGKLRRFDGAACRGVV